MRTHYQIGFEGVFARRPEKFTCSDPALAGPLPTATSAVSGVASCELRSKPAHVSRRVNKAIRDRIHRVGCLYYCCLEVVSKGDRPQCLHAWRHLSGTFGGDSGCNCRLLLCMFAASRRTSSTWWWAVVPDLWPSE